jgi:hypothetical protein
VCKRTNHSAPPPERFATHPPKAALLNLLRDFRVEWDDGSIGTAGAMAIFVRTGGLGTGHQKLELLTADDVVAILLEEKRILARTRVPRTAAIGDALRSAPARALRRLLGHRGQAHTSFSLWKT